MSVAICGYCRPYARCLIKNGKFSGIEVKSEVGRLSPEQEELGRDIILNGGMYVVVARSIDDVQHAGMKLLLPRNKRSVPPFFSWAATREDGT
jgi:hypothetical protein